ncbi:unnamed protein product [Vitrella brassicaformis CCMP3155]|uniref:FAST kinase leucine-rich domain-containing protein n=1 Tax=Vitrella brassicaformis (strain CCMP3155) TaxID=1169540 RepID=A0A0G4FNI0_VITBC|nr:unnamed protein product [Vitrella brassicaformis CCMP3155]|eukprot:CEM15776.1 unnamed protein product [Vitrella brassicaformis CCMP3155]
MACRVRCVAVPAPLPPPIPRRISPAARTFINMAEQTTQVTSAAKAFKALTELSDRKIDPSKAAWRHVLRRLREEHMYLSTPNVVATMRILAHWRTHGSAALFQAVCERLACSASDFDAPSLASLLHSLAWSGFLVPPSVPHTCVPLILDALEALTPDQLVETLSATAVLKAVDALTDAQLRLLIGGCLADWSRLDGSALCRLVHALGCVEGEEGGKMGLQRWASRLVVVDRVAGSPVWDLCLMYDGLTKMQLHQAGSVGKDLHTRIDDKVERLRASDCVQTLAQLRIAGAFDSPWMEQLFRAASNLTDSLTKHQRHELQRSLEATLLHVDRQLHSAAPVADDRQEAQLGLRRVLWVMDTRSILKRPHRSLLSWKDPGQWLLHDTSLGPHGMSGVEQGLAIRVDGREGGGRRGGRMQAVDAERQCE